ncbi:MAG: hypothetical protein ACYTG0_31510, partial [Planctomycetota bacterium]
MRKPTISPSARQERSQGAVARRAVLTMIGFALLARFSARAADIELRAECRCRGSVVTLGDVAEVRAADPQQSLTLAAIELFPAPAPGGKRFLTAREIQDQLMLRGVSPLEHRLSGSSKLVVVGPAVTTVSGEAGPLSTSRADAARRRVCDAIRQYLQTQAAGSEPFTVEVALDDWQARRLVSSPGLLEVRGGRPPWIGVQPFEITVSSAHGPQMIALEAQVTLPPAVVVATRSLPPAVVIRRGDVELQKAGS